jgi:peptidylprolyl isomerase
VPVEPPGIEQEITDPPIGIEIIDPPVVEIVEEPSITTTVVLETNKGNIKIGLFDAHRPITAGNFISLIERDFYDGLIFHRVIDGFMIQAGCPYGTGVGGPGHTIKCELEGYNKNKRGTISMANAGLNTGGSQFFINLVDNNFLDDRHAVFGRVLEGMEIVDTIGRVETTPAPENRPIEDVVINNIEIIKE